MSETPFVCEDADCKFRDDGECELCPEVKDDPVLMEKIQATYETMKNVAKLHKIPQILTRVEHNGKSYKIHFRKD